MLAIGWGDLFTPQTDTGVFVRMLITIVVTGVLLAAVRREKALVQLVLGIGMVVLAWFAFGTLH